MTKMVPPHSSDRDEKLRSRLFLDERVKVKVNSIQAFCGRFIDSLYYEVVQTQMRLRGDRSGVEARNVEDGQTNSRALISYGQWTSYWL